MVEISTGEKLVVTHQELDHLNCHDDDALHVDDGGGDDVDDDDDDDDHGGDDGR